MKARCTGRVGPGEHPRGLRAAPAPPAPGGAPRGLRGPMGVHPEVFSARAPKTAREGARAPRDAGARTGVSVSDTKGLVVLQ